MYHLPRHKYGHDRLEEYHYYGRQRKIEKLPAVRCGNALLRKLYVRHSNAQRAAVQHGYAHANAYAYRFHKAYPAPVNRLIYNIQRHRFHRAKQYPAYRGCPSRLQKGYPAVLIKQQHRRAYCGGCKYGRYARAKRLHQVYA